MQIKVCFPWNFKDFLMKIYTLKTNSLTVSEYQTLRKTTEWEKLPNHLVKHAISNGLFSVSVYKDDVIVGMGRVVGDGIYYYIQDVIVCPEHQGKGVGKLIMQYIEEYLESELDAYAFVGLMAAKDSQGFYQKLGYEERGKDSPGMYKVLSVE